MQRVATLCCLLFASTAAGSQRLFGLTVFHESSLKSSGYNNGQQLGCGVFEHEAKTRQFISFASDPANSVGLVKLDLSHLSSFVELYDMIVEELSAVGIRIQLLFSAAVPGDACALNCADYCNATIGSPNDSCTPYYLDSFHSTAASFMTRHPNISMGISYDIDDESYLDPSTSIPIWSDVWDRIERYGANMTATRSLWGGYSYMQPDFTEGTNSTFLSGARSLDNQWFFTPSLKDWDVVNASLWTPMHTTSNTGIVDQAKWCRSENRTCKITVGLQTSVEVAHGYNNHSFVWGGGLPSNETMLDFVERSVLPQLVAHGINITTDLDDPPFFVDHQASFMAYMSNARSGALPAPQCNKPKDPGCTSCCPQQKNKKLCSQ